VRAYTIRRTGGLYPDHDYLNPFEAARVLSGEEPANERRWIDHILRAQHALLSLQEGAWQVDGRAASAQEISRALGSLADPVLRDREWRLFQMTDFRRFLTSGAPKRVETLHLDGIDGDLVAHVAPFLAARLASRLVAAWRDRSKGEIRDLMAWVRALPHDAADAATRPFYNHVLTDVERLIRRTVGILRQEGPTRRHGTELHEMSWALVLLGMLPEFLQPLVDAAAFKIGRALFRLHGSVLTGPKAAPLVKSLKTLRLTGDARLAADRLPSRAPREWNLSVSIFLFIALIYIVFACSIVFMDSSGNSDLGYLYRLTAEPFSAHRLLRSQHEFVYRELEKKTREGLMNVLLTPGSLGPLGRSYNLLTASAGMNTWQQLVRTPSNTLLRVALCYHNNRGQSVSEITVTSLLSRASSSLESLPACQWRALDFPVPTPDGLIPSTVVVTFLAEAPKGGSPQPTAYTNSAELGLPDEARLQRRPFRGFKP